LTGNINVYDSVILTFLELLKINALLISILNEIITAMILPKNIQQ